MANSFAEIDHFSRQFRVNVQQDPVEGVRLHKRTTFSERGSHLHLKPVGPQYACSQAALEFGSADEKDSLSPAELMREWGYALHTRLPIEDIFLFRQGHSPTGRGGRFLYSVYNVAGPARPRMRMAVDWDDLTRALLWILLPGALIVERVR